MSRLGRTDEDDALLAIQRKLGLVLCAGVVAGVLAVCSRAEDDEGVAVLDAVDHRCLDVAAAQPASAASVNDLPATEKRLAVRLHVDDLEGGAPLRHRNL